MHTLLLYILAAGLICWISAFTYSFAEKNTGKYFGTIKILSYSICFLLFFKYLLIIIKLMEIHGIKSNFFISLPSLAYIVVCFFSWAKGASALKKNKEYSNLMLENEKKAKEFYEAMYK